LDTSISSFLSRNSRPKITPLKIRGARGVMKITPFIPLTLRGRFNESPYFKESLKPAFSFLACGELPYWLLATG